jgi:RNA polymerase sigma-70 factor (ECF subfamily)
MPDERAADEVVMVEAWRRGEEPAVRAIFEAWYPRAVRLAALSGLPRDAAQDCAQDAFVHAYERRQQLRDAKAFPLWFHRIITRRILDTLERRGLDRAVPLDDAGDLEEDWQRRAPDQPEALALSAEAREHLWQRVQSLPTRYRMALVLRYYGDLPLREVADLLDMREGTLRVTIHRALGQLRALYQRDQPCPVPAPEC